MPLVRWSSNNDKFCHSRCSCIKEAFRQEQANCLNLNVRIPHKCHREMNDRLCNAEHGPHEEHIAHDPLDRLPRRATPPSGVLVVEAGRRTDIEVRAFGFFGFRGERRGYGRQGLAPSEEQESVAAFLREGGGKGRLDILSRRRPLLARFSANSANDVYPVEPFFQIDSV